MITKVLNELIKKRDILARFIIVGTVGFISNYALFAPLAYVLNIPKQISEILAIVVSVHVTFYLNNKWTYNHIDKSQSLNKYIKYIVSNAAASGISYTIFILFIYLFNHSKITDLLALAISSGAGMIWNFILNTYLIWKHSNDSTIS